MDSYTVKAGDSLAGIAMKLFGNANKWREIADINSIADPTKIKIGQVLRLPPTQGTVSGVDLVEITTEGKKVFYRLQGTTDKIFLGNLFRLGLSRMGNFNTERFIINNSALLDDLKLSRSEISTLLATSQNEGNLDAINTYDNQFLSFGMFQWTLGGDNGKGELAALLKVSKNTQPASFQKFFGSLGVDVSADTNDVSGFLILNGNKMDTAVKKAVFRSNEWALNFALAGKEPTLCAAQILHAVNRFNRFYFTALPNFDGLSISDMLSSEYAASLLLDQHVNRPSHVAPVVAEALKQTGITAHQLAAGTDADELKVINKYLSIRETFGNPAMTDSGRRAQVVKSFLDQGKISAKKASFKSNRQLRSQ